MSDSKTLNAQDGLIFGDVIYAYTRTQAIEDGVLVDVSETAREAGFKIPVAVTCEVWGRYVDVPPGVRCQDERGRLWDILWMARSAAQRLIPAIWLDATTFFYVLYVRNSNDEKPKRVQLKAVCGPNDDGSPCITIMLPEED